MRAQFDPLSELDRLEREFHDVARATRADRRAAAGPAAPAVDVYERDGAVIAMVELPGVKPQDVRVHLDGDHVTVSGKRSRLHTERLGGCFRLESSCGTFRRTFTLPEKVDPTRAEAHFEDGILTLRLVKLGS